MTEPFDVNGKVIAITGASSGFGHHFAGVLARHGAITILGARRTEKLSERVTEISSTGGSAQAYQLDVTDKTSITQFLDQTFAESVSYTHLTLPTILRV